MTTAATAAPVQLRAYDLLRGFGTQLNLGIWHTGVVVYNYEFFFGGGLVSLPLGRFEIEHGIAVAKIVDIGTTSKTFEEIQNWINAHQSEWAAENYDLIRRNCNHFSDAFLRFLLDVDSECVPREILHQHEFLPPFAQQFLPMVEAFQSQLTGAMVPGQAPPGPARPQMATQPLTQPSTAASSAPPTQPPSRQKPQPTPFTQSLDRLVLSPSTSLQAKKDAVKVLSNLAKNAKENATEVKYRTVKTSNPSISSLVGMEHGKDCLENLGFKASGDGSVFSLGNNLNFEVLGGLQVGLKYCSEVQSELDNFESGRYSTEISQLKAMGFDNEFKNFKALVKSRGFIDGALDQLMV
eukprot:Gregarina_sp_Pseudo_9__992@NODE_1639_length_1430_cov_40_071172_g1519_i0_p1_GENE_NODE_1639_length_1430_cov_40_071172_g1519_i0NODE_1639_length_1430_cov_40_071172_g1519_i0_p1_ORF_typecomplete_len352_score90_29Peptidase_C97/PF05903_14/2e26PUB/PF09409_10/1_3e03PUB/PF09409_10/3_9e11PUB/PF09409_10/3_7e03UBA/PF00627_31/0_17DUF4796/PF16044_5/0_14LRAT/PF04970_13/0_32LRAT/PF04970_13/1_5e04UBA_5/PF16577_5/0_32NUT/PF12881_7/0_62SRA1/PF07304_11/1_7e04SRA1/PF07304_11/1_3_NODE_1639_length_1430_cov_40_071172_g15